MHWLQITRLVVLSFVLLCSIIVAPISAHLTAFAVENFKVYYNFAILGVVTGAMTLISVAVMLIVDALRTGAFTSWVIVELCWLSVLWVFWIATGALTVDQTAAVFSTCQFANPLVNQLCHESQSIEGFSFLAWLALMGYIITLFVVALINVNRGVPSWKSTVRQIPPVVPAATTGPTISISMVEDPHRQQTQQLLQSHDGSPATQWPYQDRSPQTLYTPTNTNGAQTMYAPPNGQTTTSPPKIYY